MPGATDSTPATSVLVDADVAGGDMVKQEEPPMRLPPRLDGSSVAAARDELFAAIDRSNGDVVVEMSGVELIDVTGLGLLAAAHDRSRRLGHRLVLEAPSAVVRRALAVTGLGRALRFTA
jgi:anti-sigma B factor antagonist